MDVLLIGGGSSLMDAMINKLNKEGHRVYILTGNHNRVSSYKNAYEKYYFPYDSDCLKEIFDSIRPEVTLFLGAYDTNFDWSDDKRESVRYLAGLVNILIAYSLLKKGRFIYLSSEEVFSAAGAFAHLEEEPASADGFRAMAVAQGEEMCLNYRQRMGVDTVILRMDHLYDVPKNRSVCKNLCIDMCMEALREGYISVNQNHKISMLAAADAVEFLFLVLSKKELRYPIYHISSGELLDELQLAKLIQTEIGNQIEIHDNALAKTAHSILNGERFKEEFKISVFHPMEQMVPQVARYVRRHSARFLGNEGLHTGGLRRFLQKSGGILKALIPFAENLVCFIPFFMLNNRAVGSEYFANLDFYLLYVLLFAIVYGQQQAAFSGILAVAGYCFRQMYHRSGLDVLLDHNTYVWIAQLFILGLVVGYMRDQLRVIRGEKEKEVNYLSGQLKNIQDINISNVRMKNVLETQIVNQNDSFGKIYDITSGLDKYEPEEVLFYAAEVLAKLLDSKDVAIYTVANHSYARLFSATSKKARQLGNSIPYTTFGGMYQDLKERRVYINKTLDERYPLMANAIYSEDEMQLILMIWGIPWERMTLGQANMLVVVGYLIQNAVIRANRYMEALKNSRYVAGTGVLDMEAFTSLVKAYLGARSKGLAECTILEIYADMNTERDAALMKLMRQTDYLGKLSGERLCALLANTSREDADFVIRRFEQAGYESRILEEDKI